MHQKVLSMILVLVMLLGLLSVSAFTVKDTTSSDSAASNDDSFYRIVHLDCGRKYFTKDWIIALLNEMKADGYNQLQLAFGNDGLRFLLDNMSFEANGKEYSHSDVVSKVEAGNRAQNESGDERWLTQSQMDDIISAAKALGIEIVPLLNLPGHANTILDIADDQLNASGSSNTLDVANSEAARSFGMAIFQKYVDYFASRGCKFFSFGADEYANDVYSANDPNFSFNQLNDNQYSQFVGFVNRLATYISNKENVDGVKMTPRAFNDGLYFSNKSSSVEVNTDIQCCYWSSGWGYYQVASASTIAQNGHAMINTHGDYYYVLGKQDNFDGGYSYASGFNNTAFMSGPIQKNPVGSMFCIWCDKPNAENEQTVAQKVRLPMRAMALRMNNQSIDGMDTSEVVNGFKANGKLNTGSAGGSETENVVNITVAVNGTFKKTVSGANYACDEGYTTADETVASVVVNGEDATKSEPIYDSVDVSYSTLAGNNSTWAKTNYYYKDGDEYCPVYAYKKTTGWIIKTTYYYYGYMPVGEAQVKEIDNATRGSSTVKVYEQTGVKEGTPASTTITFTGHKVGDTTVAIGGVTYKIHVTAEDLSNVTPLKLEYWITNAPITSVTGSQTVQRTKVLPDNQGNYNNYTVYFTNIMANATGVNSEAGIDVTMIAPANTSHDNRTVYYWRCRMLDMKLENTSTSKTQQQTADGGDDETVSGIGFTKIRYYGGNWQVFTENNAWVTVDTVNNQLVAYYLENIKVSDEVDSFAADWGNRGDGSSGGWLDTSNYCTLSMQVVYEDGTTNPTGTAAKDLKSKTIVYGYWSNNNGRGIGTVLLEGQEYEIYKVTSETGEATASFSGSNNAKVTNFAWDKNETTVWEGDPSSSVSIHNNTNDFSSEGVNANLCWNENKEAILLRVYVRAKVTEDSLTVNYFDENNTSLPFYSYNIAVASGTTFSNQFTYVPGSANEKASLSNNTVENIKGVTQTVNWQLEKMPEIGAQYRFGNYTFTSATKESGNKVVNLYYRFNSEKTFVVDFGLPLHIAKTDISPELSQANIQGVAVGNSLYATVRANDDYSIDYILNKTIDGSDRITVTYTGTKVNGDSDSATYNLTVIPATSVYYEDSFATFTNRDGTSGVSSTDKGYGYWVTDGTTNSDAKQALEELKAKQNVYGYDPAYASCNQFSMGSATKVTVDADTSNDGQSPTATFTFKGTGFDVISLTGNQSGTVMYTVTNKGTNEKFSNLVNTYYGYKYDNGEWTTTTAADPNALYQIPVIREVGLLYGEYEVTISVLYGKYFNSTTNDFYSFWLDAIRVYDPMVKDKDNYAQDGEGYPQYIKLHDEISKDDSPVNANVLFIDGGPEADVDTYKKYGPNNEVYLAEGQAIMFNVPVNPDIASIQIGAKAPSGSAAQMVVNKGTPMDIQSATEMYYKIDTDDGSFTITNKGKGILSLTNLKITFTASGNTVTLKTPTAEEQKAAVMSVRALFAEPEQTFAPEYFTATWSRNVHKGGKATLTVKTSADVEAIMVGDQTIDSYKVRTERSGWGSSAKKMTYHVFTYTVTATATADYTVCAINADGVVSDPITATLTVRPSIRDWWHSIFDKWRH